MDSRNGRVGLSDVISTLVILVVAVLLAGLATYYGVNTTTTKSSYEAVTFDYEHVWVNSTGTVSAFLVQENGGRDILIDRITVRTIESSWSDIYYYRVPVNTKIRSDMNLTSSALLTGPSVTIGGKQYTRASGDLPLKSGGEMLFYVKNPGYIGVDDIGTMANINIFSVNAEYSIEVNVESATTQ